MLFEEAFAHIAKNCWQIMCDKVDDLARLKNYVFLRYTQ